MEQCEQQTKNKTLEGDFYARYRTVKDYRRLFAKAGLRISRLTVMGERTYGPCLNALLRYNFVYQRLPKALHRIIPGLFHIDRFLLSLGRRRILDAAPTDVLFQLEKV